MAIAVARRTVELDRRLRAGETVPSAHNLGLSLHGKVVGLVGMGDIAREAAKKFHYGSSCQIIIYSPTSPLERWTANSPFPEEAIIPHKRMDSLDELLQQSDVVSLHCPEVPETINMMSKKQFDKMKKTAIFLNLGRGALVDEEALYEACKNKRILGAGMHFLHGSTVRTDVVNGMLLKVSTSFRLSLSMPPRMASRSSRYQMLLYNHTWLPRLLR